MLYRMLVRMIAREQTHGLTVKLDAFLAAGKITESEHTDLVSRITV